MSPSESGSKMSMTQQGATATPGNCSQDASLPLINRGRDTKSSVTTSNGCAVGGDVI